MRFKRKVVVSNSLRRTKSSRSGLISSIRVQRKNHIRHSPSLQVHTYSGRRTVWPASVDALEERLNYDILNGRRVSSR